MRAAYPLVTVSGLPFGILVVFVVCVLARSILSVRNISFSVSGSSGLKGMPCMPDVGVLFSGGGCGQNPLAASHCMARYLGCPSVSVRL